MHRRVSLKCVQGASATRVSPEKASKASVQRRVSLMVSKDVRAALCVANGVQYVRAALCVANGVQDVRAALCVAKKVSKTLFNTICRQMGAHTASCVV